MQILTSVVQLQPGLYLLRHPGNNMPPLSVTQTPNTRAEIDVLTARPSGALVLENGSDCIVMRVANAPAELLVAAFSPTSAASAPAMKVDRVALDAPAQSITSATPVLHPVSPVMPIQPPAQNKLVIKDRGVSIVGHVERLGNVVAAEGEVCGNPAALQRIEGFQLMWPDRPDGVDLAYSVVVEGSGPLPAARSGKYVGSRGESKRITEVSIALIGPYAGRFQLAGTAYFSGGFQVALRSGVPAAGPSGMEHLTALALRIVPAVTAPARGANEPAARAAGTARVKAAPDKRAVPKKTAEKKPASGKSVRPTPKTRKA